MSAAESGGRIPVSAKAADVVSARMPTAAERQALGILSPDVPVLSIKRPGRAEELFDARIVEIIANGLCTWRQLGQSAGRAAVALG